jgi:hypothetical protein
MRHPAAFEKLLLFALACVGITILIKTNLLTIQPFQQFVDLANSFFRGRLDFLPDARSIYDSSYFEGKYFWPLGPFPAFLVMPMVAIFDIHFQLGYMQFFLILLLGYFAYKIGQKIIGDSLWALWLSFGFIFSTTFIGIAYVPWSWQFAQVVATTFMFAALYEFFYKKRWWLIGLFLAIAVATRTDLIIAVLFFGGNALLAHHATREKVKQLALLLVPVGISLVLLFLYNYFRFHNIFDQGYTTQHLSNPFLQANRDMAVWGFVHIPANLYYFLLRGPDAVVLPGTQILTYPYIKMDGWGMSIFFTSPIFLWIVKAPFRKKEVMLASITALIIAFSIFGYYGIGFDQFGYRYAIDFYPFLFILLLYAIHKRPSILLKVVIVLSFCFNSYLLLTRPS